MKQIRSLFSGNAFFGLSLLTLALMALGCSKITNQTGAPVSEPRAENEFEGDVERRMDWFMRQRTYPFDKIPDDARRKAWDARPADAVDNLLGGTLWNSIGPSPTTSAFPGNWGVTSGRINAVAVSPTNAQIVLIGGATGGIWRSTNGGDTFAPTTDSQVDLAVGLIAFAPSNSSIVYAGMGDKAGSYLGTGVLKSTDAGQSWTRISNTTLPSPGRISAILVHPTNPNVVYVAQYVALNGGNIFSSGFYYSVDGGVNWTNSRQGLPRDLVQHPTNANTIYMAMDRDNSGAPTTGGIFKSVDAGQNWTRVYTSPFANTSNIKIATTPAAPSNLYVLVGESAQTPAAPRVEVSTNEGGMWTNLGVGSGFDGGQFGYNCYLFVHPTDANTIYVGTRDLWRSTNGGLNYTNITNNFQLNGAYTPGQSKAHPDQHHFYQSPGNPNLIFLANDGGLWRSLDGGQSFQTLNASLSLTMFVGIDLHPTNAAISYGGTQDNGTQRRTGANTWQEFTAGDGGQTVIDAVDPSIVFTTYIYKDISRWLNNGDTYDGQIGFVACQGCVDNVFNGDRVAFYPPLVGNEVNSNLYFGTYRLYISTNRGANWTLPGGATDLTNGGELSAIGVARSNTNNIYTGSSDGRLMVSTNGGANWTDRSAGLPDRFIKSIVVSPTNADTAYVTVSGFNSGHVFKTVNAGATWTDISGNLPNIPANTLLIKPNAPATLYVGTDIGVFRSTTDGTTWETFNNGMPPVIISELDSQASGILTAGTYGRGAYVLNTAAANRAPFDFDGDRKTDVGIFRPSNGQWWIQRSSNLGTTVATFGVSTDKTVPADYTGDGKADIAFFRPGSGEWFILRSENFSFYSFPFGAGTDTPVPADFDADGKADAAIFRPSEANWYILQSSGGTRIEQFGANGDIPVVGDYDGDSRADKAIFRPNVGQWWVNRSTNNGTIVVAFGVSTDKTAQGDYTGDGKTDVAFWRPATGEWFVLRSEDFSFFSFPFGAGTDLPVPGDYDGDGKIDAAVFRPGNVTWYINGSQAGSIIQSYGALDDYPVPNSYVR